MTLVHARIYESPNSPAIDDATIVIHNGRIAAVQAPSKAAVAIASGSTVIDCTGMSVAAGLWNSHIHILPVKLLHAHEKTGPQLTAALQEMLTRWGFTTVFDVASILANTNDIRTRIEAGDILGPRILTTGEPFFPLHGIPSYVSGYLEQNHISIPDDATPALAVERVQQEIRAGANGIKIFAGSVEGASVLLMPLNRAQAIVNETHRLTSLTTTPARRFGFVAHRGRIAATMDADLAVFKGDPAVDVMALSRVNYTIRSGKVIFRAAVIQPDSGQ